MTELIPVNIVIADRTFRLKIQPEDEEMVRNTVKLINEKIVEFKTNFAGKDMQDYISMVLVWMATEQTKASEQIILLKDTSEQLAQMEAQVDRAL